MNRVPVKHRFTTEWALERVADALSRPPPLRKGKPLARPEPTGAIVATFVLPLELLEAQNRRSHAPDWVMAKKRAAIWQRLHVQMFIAGIEHPPEPLPGRPVVRCIRFSSVKPDRFADTFKQAVDALCAPKARRKRGLGFLRDDNDDDCELHQTWEPAPPGKGFGLIQVFADPSADKRSDPGSVGARPGSRPSNVANGKASNACSR